MLSLKIKNFRSIKNTKLDIAPLTLFYGPNGSGKSSILYSLLVMKRVVLNPSTSLDEFFNLGFSNLGGFEQVIYDHNKEKNMEMAIKIENGMEYGISLGQRESFFYITPPGGNTVKLPVTFPYQVNKNVLIKMEKVEIPWNGITALSGDFPENIIEDANKFMRMVNSPVELLRGVEFVPLKRGFTKPTYAPVNVTPSLISEDEIATLLANNRYLEGKVLSYGKDIFGKIFQVRPQVGTGIFYLQMVDDAGMTFELINEGFGLNQTVFMLAKLLRNETRVLLVEEPEIHLHPTAQRKLVHAFIRAIKEEGKHIVISTHSEHILLSVLSSVAGGKISPEEVSCYLVKKKRKESVIQQQKVNEKGQIENGLSSFLEGELEDIKTLLGG
ncbi:MAG: hypothetical protein DRN40_01355 [Thermoplasmata archaeon]|nr:MAG: hypothetical protein DRN40_01355 [Thermoplasmata archaeon]